MKILMGTKNPGKIEGAKQAFEKYRSQGFSGSSVVKNPSAGVGDVGLIPDLGGSHMPQSSYTCVPQQ